MRRGARPGGRVSRSREQRRQRRRRLVLATVLVACLPLPLAGATLAAFSDWDIVPDLTVGAGSLTVASGNDGLTLGPLGPGDQAAGLLSFANGGTVNADVAVQFGAFGELCAGAAPDKLGITVTLAGTDVVDADLCTIGQAPIPVGENLDVGVISALEVTVSLSAEADVDWRDRWGTAEVRFLGSQPGGGFSDLDATQLTVSTDHWEPVAPFPPDPRDGPIARPACLPDSEYSWKIVIPDGGGWHFDLTNADLSSLASVKAALTGAFANEWWQPITVTPLGGGPDKGVRVEAHGTSLTMIGTPFDDCFEVWDGSYTISGGSGDDILMTLGARTSEGTSTSFFGGDGNDTLYSDGNGSGNFHGGSGNDLLYARNSTGMTFNGDDGDDVLYSTGTGGGVFDGGAGNDVLWVGNRSGYTLRGGPGDDYLRGPDTQNGSTQFFGGLGHDICEGAGPKVECDVEIGAFGASMLMLDDEEMLLEEGDDAERGEGPLAEETADAGADAVLDDSAEAPDRPDGSTEGDAAPHSDHDVEVTEPEVPAADLDPGESHHHDPPATTEPPDSE